MNSLLLWLCTASIFSLLAVSIDRFYAINWPLAYPRRMTHTLTLAVIGCSWLLASVIGE